MKKLRSLPDFCLCGQNPSSVAPAAWGAEAKVAAWHRREGSDFGVGRRRTTGEERCTCMADNSAQMGSAAFRLPALDTDYLLRDSMRGARFLLEYSKAEELLRAWGVRSTVVVFGSARVRPGAGADANAASTPLPPDAKPRPGGQSARWYDEARRFARI